MIKSLNRGIFKVSLDVINNHPELVHEIFLSVIPIRTDHDLMTDHVTYHCVGDVFDEVPLGTIIPTYSVNIDTKQMTVEFEKNG